MAATTSSFTAPVGRSLRTDNSTHFVAAQHDAMRPQITYVLHDAGTPSTTGTLKKKDEDMETDYFLATLCDQQRAVTATRFGLRYSKTREVSELLTKIERSRFTARDLVHSHPNIILSVLKGIH
ncbi:unnamed protein product [Heligmosomoides polygyrus]|uniref:Integrase catalytic domain-containing protein n=1 Tax=Heligmosomoides polygyrus TaxID=6339 RepID=A0A183FHH1_HELPZ|nr:unnamed protein product [Heligmosomoides polygyrus]